MAQPPQKPPAPPPATSSRAVLAALLGVSIVVATGIGTQITADEGRVFKAYYDPGHVLTICDGDTTDVHVGEVDTPAQCDARRDRQLIAHAGPILQCTPSLKGHANQVSAAVNFGYNIGVGNYCGSTVAKEFNANHWRSACNHMMDWSAQWAKFRIQGAISCTPKARAGTPGFMCVLPGLVERRKRNTSDCLKDLAA